MPPLPRADCPVCHASVALRRNSAFREHWYEPNGKCEGSGKTLEEPTEEGWG